MNLKYIHVTFPLFGSSFDRKYLIMIKVTHNENLTLSLFAIFNQIVNRSCLSGM